MAREDKQPSRNGYYYPLSKDEADPVDAFVVDGAVIGFAQDDRFVLFVADIRGGRDVPKGFWGYSVIEAVRIAQDPVDSHTVNDRTFNGQFTADTAVAASTLASPEADDAYTLFRKLILSTPPR